MRRVEIPKSGGGKRQLGIPTVMDRVIQQAIAQVLTPIFDPTFSESSFGFRPGRNAHQAIRQVQTIVKGGKSTAVDIDLAKFFDTVNHDVLMNLLARSIADKRLLLLIGRYLRAGVLVGEQVEPSEVGTPQGGPLSPLLANILLHQLNLELERRGHRFARYADDMVILVKSERAAQRVMGSITRYLETTLKLRVNLAKSKVAPMSECAFLGFTIKGKKIRWTDKALANFQHRIKELTGRSWGFARTQTVLRTVCDWRRVGASGTGAPCKGIHGIPPAKAGAIHEGMDGILWHQPVLPPGTRTGRVDQTAHAYVLLETVALASHKDQESAGLGREPEVGDSARMQQQQLLANVQNPRDQSGNFQRVAKGARFAQCERPVVPGPGLHGKESKGFVERANLLNRPLRTRTVGGVGGDG